MRRRNTLAGLLLLLMFTGTCAPEEEAPSESREFAFVVYPGSRYLGQLTDLTREAHKLINPKDHPPPVAIYDSEDSLEKVAQFYAKSYGYETIAPGPATPTPPAYYRSGDLSADVKAIESLLPRLSIQKTDSSKATGTYRAVDIAPRPNRPRITIQRPYFDVTTSQVVDRTMILMTR